MQEYKFLTIQPATDLMKETYSEFLEPVKVMGYAYEQMDLLESHDPVAFEQELLGWMDQSADQGEFFVKGYTDPEDYERAANESVRV